MMTEPKLLKLGEVVVSPPPPRNIDIAQLLTCDTDTGQYHMALYG